MSALKPNSATTHPSGRETAITLAALAVWIGVTALFVGLRPEHVFLAVLIAVLFFACAPTRRLLMALLPFAVFGASYDWMNILHNYEVNPVDIQGIYMAEKSLFGITTAAGSLLTPNEFLAIHTHPVLDVLGGLFYLCWVPAPMLFGIYLYYSRHESAYLHFALVFLLTNFIGFAGYYIHPAAPPWYVAQYGFEYLPGTPGSTAGLAAFDRFVGLDIFESIYGRNSNVFAAVPSLHSAYTLVAFIYSLRARSPRWMQIALGVITMGIWATAVYTFHHYLIDVLLGIGTALVAFLLFEYVLMRLRPFARFMHAYTRYITPPNR